MRLSEIGGKEIVNLCDGSRLGVIAESDLLINEKTGKIESLLIPKSKNLFTLFSNEYLTQIPWTDIKKIGSDMIIIELDSDNKKIY